MLDDDSSENARLAAEKRSSAAVIATTAVLAFVLGAGIAWLIWWWPFDTHTAAPSSAVRMPSEVGSGTVTRIPAQADSGEASATPDSAAETCGLTPYPSGLDSAEPLRRNPEADRRIAEKTRAIIDALESSSDERTRASGLVLQHGTDIAAGFAAVRASVRDACGDDEACTQSMVGRPLDVIEHYGQAATEALAHVASGTRDPFVYAMGLKLCQWTDVGVSAAPGCQLLSADQWARIDPDNAVAWLYVANQAAERKDAAAVAEAMNRVAHAASNRSYADLAGAIVDAAIPPGPEEAAMWLSNVGQMVPLLSPPLLVASRYCAAPDMADNNRAQMCDAVAHALTDRGSTFVEQRVGIRIGERAGWPPGQVAAMRSESDALMHFVGQSFNTVSECSDLRRQRANWQMRGRLGEVGAARAYASESGKSMSTLVEEAAVERAALAAAAAERPSRPASAEPVGRERRQDAGDVPASMPR